MVLFDVAWGHSCESVMYGFVWPACFLPLGTFTSTGVMVQNGGFTEVQYIVLHTSACAWQSLLTVLTCFLRSFCFCCIPAPNPMLLKWPQSRWSLFVHVSQRVLNSTI